MLALVKSGVRTKSGIAGRLEVDVRVVSEIIKSCVSNGLLLKGLAFDTDGRKIFSE